KKAKKMARKAKKKAEAAARKAKAAAKKTGRAAKKVGGKALALSDPRYALFSAYLGQMGAGVKKYRLTKTYRNAIQPYYKAPLSQHRFGYGKRQPKRNATTDCRKTYYNNKGYVNRLKNGKLGISDFKWLFHELGHFQQCSDRKFNHWRYSNLWWNHLSLAAFKKLLKPNRLKKLHDLMKMEKDAERIANRVWNKFSKKYKTTSARALVLR
ncbi:MAG: hypothetical protein V3V56_09065, partial [bacterium]